MKRQQPNRLIKALHESSKVLRRFSNGHESQDYLIVILFFKFLCDRQDWLASQNLEPRYLVPPESTFNKLLTDQINGKVAEQLNSAFVAIEATNFDLRGIFSAFRLTERISSRTVADLSIILALIIEIFSKVELGDPGIEIGNTFLAWLEDSAKQSRYLGFDVTLPALVTMLIELVRPRATETLYDPTCGTGSLLTKAARYAKSESGRIFGQDVSAIACSTARINLILNDFEEGHIACEDTLVYPKFIEHGDVKKFDTVLCNPPLGLNWEPDRVRYDHRFQRGLAPRSNADWAFLSHILESLAENGRAAIVVSLGVLFRSGSERDVRSRFVTDNVIDAVIQLPTSLLSNSSISVAILVLKRSRDSRDVLFIDASSLAEKSSFGAYEIKRVASAYHRRLEEERFARKVTIDEIALLDYSLSVPQYTASALASIDYEQLAKNLISLNMELLQIDEGLSEYF